MKKTGEGHLLKDNLENYSDKAYKKPSITVDVVICTIKDGRLMVLLIKRKHPPFRDSWAIPGGFVNIDKEETLGDAARRELNEETGVMNIYVEQLGTYGDPHRDPRTRVITVAYYALVPWGRLSGQDIRGMDDAKEARWFPLDDLPKTAFDHVNILHDALNRIRGKINYFPIAFEFVRDKQGFTWTELQGVYETVLGEDLIPGNFRRKINALYILRQQGITHEAKKVGRPEILLNYIEQRKAL